MSVLYTEGSFCCIPCVIDIDSTESVENLIMAEKHRAAAEVKNRMSLSADSMVVDAMPKRNQKILVLSSVP